MVIGDTKVTCDVTFKKKGTTDTETPEDSNGVVAYNGENDKP